MDEQEAPQRSPATEPEDLALLLVDRVNAGDLEGVVALYEPDAVLALPGGEVAVGRDAIRRFYSDLLASNPRFELEDQLPALRLGDLSLTSRTGGAPRGRAPLGEARYAAANCGAS